MLMRKTTLLALSAVAAATLTLSACSAPGSNPNAPTPPAVSTSDATLQPTLAAHNWTLVSATDAQNKRIDALFPKLPVPRPIVLGFADGRVSIQGGCNLRGGAFQINAAQQLVVGPMPSTMMACEPPLMQIDKTLAAVLAKPAAVSVAAGTPPKLALVSAAGETLVFTGQQTHEAMYGPATRMFMEVAPQKVACNNPVMPNAQCLLVRERKFDANGLPINPPGPWGTFHGTIDGFTHEAGLRNVLRVKRFTRKNVPADASSYVFVLDMVVETERVTG